MATQSSDARVSGSVVNSDVPRPTPAKAGLRSDRIGLAFTAVVKDAIVRHYGSVKAAAISLHKDPSQMQRDFDAGKFGCLERCDDEAKAFIARALHEAFGDADPKAQARRAIREVRARLDELQELVS